jgi:L,D-transpeptidase YbiS
MNKNTHIEIDISRQTLLFLEDDEPLHGFRISTAKNGIGELMDSECTPRGKHRISEIISEMIGEDCQPNTVFVGRVPTGEIYSPELREQFPDRDWILTGILWLDGCEEGKNKGGNVDSHDRHIYIHGSPDDIEMGEPGSRGCVRMHNEDIIDLFKLVDTETTVDIIEECVD